MRRVCAVILLLCGIAYGKCGVERWPIKTLADKEIGEINWIEVDTTVEELRDWKAPTDLHAVPDHRHRPVEFTRFKVHAVLLGYKREADQDFHLVIASPKDHKITMIAEIPSGSCVPVGFAIHEQALQSWVIRNFGTATAKFKRLKKPVPVVVEGIGFFDFLHGQTGVAPNGIELHPVTDITMDPPKQVSPAAREDEDDEIVLSRNN